MASRCPPRVLGTRDWPTQFSLLARQEARLAAASAHWQHAVGFSCHTTTHSLSEAVRDVPPDGGSREPGNPLHRGSRIGKLVAKFSAASVAMSRDLHVWLSRRRLLPVPREVSYAPRTLGNVSACGQQR